MSLKLKMLKNAFLSKLHAKDKGDVYLYRTQVTWVGQFYKMPIANF